MPNAAESLLLGSARDHVCLPASAFSIRRSGTSHIERHKNINPPGDPRAHWNDDGIATHIQNRRDLPLEVTADGKRQQRFAFFAALLGDDGAATG